MGGDFNDDQPRIVTIIEELRRGDDFFSDFWVDADNHATVNKMRNGVQEQPSKAWYRDEKNKDFFILFGKKEWNVKSNDELKSFRWMGPAQGENDVDSTMTLPNIPSFSFPQDHVIRFLPIAGK